MNKDTLSDIPTGTLVQGAVEVIERLILEGSIKPGEHLREKELESRVGISRTPIREALRSVSGSESIAWSLTGLPNPFHARAVASEPSP